jgi:hypothetical protein
MCADSRERTHLCSDDMPFEPLPHPYEIVLPTGASIGKGQSVSIADTTLIPEPLQAGHG